MAVVALAFAAEAYMWLMILKSLVSVFLTTAIAAACD